MWTKKGAEPRSIKRYVCVWGGGEWVVCTGEGTSKKVEKNYKKEISEKII